MECWSNGFGSFGDCSNTPSLQSPSRYTRAAVTEGSGLLFLTIIGARAKPSGTYLELTSYFCKHS